MGVVMATLYHLQATLYLFTSDPLPIHVELNPMTLINFSGKKKSRHQLTSSIGVYPYKME